MEQNPTQIQLLIGFRLNLTRMQPEPHPVYIDSRSFEEKTFSFSIKGAFPSSKSPLGFYQGFSPHSPPSLSSKPQLLSAISWRLVQFYFQGWPDPEPQLQASPLLSIRSCSLYLTLCWFREFLPFLLFCFCWIYGGTICDSSDLDH